ncbi:uncharacterized protein [Heliangelus exortis]|uniref:uncharacterized protein isoform X1 n=1 Tax=Heliangelus exortis TaxID=472823 RepID=UPI003A90DB6A
MENNLLDCHLETVKSANMSHERPVNPSSPTLTKDLKRKRGRPKKQPQRLWSESWELTHFPSPKHKAAGVLLAIFYALHCWEGKDNQEEAVGPLPVKKPRGRPRGSKKVITVSQQMVEPSAGKRPRGRPRKWPQLVVQEGAAQEGNPQGSSDLNLNSTPSTQGITGKDGSRPGKTSGLRRSLSNIPATAQ